jgi:hypothetical protein
MRNGLIPEQRVDVNGKLTTRWVKAGADGKPVPRGIPAPKSTSAKETASRLRTVLFPETQTFDANPEEEYAVTMNGLSTFYSPAFAQQTMERLPARTLKVLENTLDELPDGVAKAVVAQCVYDLMREMFDMGGTAAAPLIMKAQARLVSNACAFSEMTDVISRVEEYSVSDHMFLLSQSLQAYENGGFHRQNPTNSEIDYSASSAANTERVQNYVMADQLHRHFGSPVERLPEDAVKLVGDYRGQWDRLAELARDRGFSSMDALRAVMDSEVTAVSEGVL